MMNSTFFNPLNTTDYALSVADGYNYGLETAISNVQFISLAIFIGVVALFIGYVLMMRFEKKYVQVAVKTEVESEYKFYRLFLSAVMLYLFLLSLYLVLMRFAKVAVAGGM